MNSLALAPAQYSDVHPVDLEAAQPSTHSNGALRPSLNTSLKMAGTGLAFLGAAACVAMDLAKGVGETANHDLGRSLLQDNDGCKEGEYRSKMSKATETRYKWAFVGQACAVGLGLLSIPFYQILPKNKCTTALLFPPIFGGTAAVGSLMITGIFYGFGKANDGRCISAHSAGRS